MENILLLAIIIGILNAYCSIYRVRLGLDKESEPDHSNNIDFIFILNNNK